MWNNKPNRDYSRNDALSREVKRIHLGSEGEWPGNLPAPVEQSWKRCLENYNLIPDQVPHADVLTHSEMRQLTGQYEELLSIAGSEVERLFVRLVDSEYLVSLASPEGVMMLFHCDYQFLGDMADFGVLPGSIWKEEKQGTNGVGTCLLEGRSMTIIGDQHFGAPIKNLTCTTSPVFGQAQAIDCILNVTTAHKVDNRTNRVVHDIVERTSRRIENRYFAKLYPSYRLLRLTRDGHMGDISEEARLAIDDNGRIIASSSYLSSLLDRTSAQLIGESVETVFEMDRKLEDIRPEQTLTLNFGPKALQATISGSERRRSEVLFRSKSAIPDLTSFIRQAPATNEKQALESDLAMKFERARRLLSAGLSITISGETGAGKTDFAQRIARSSSSEGSDLVFIDCSAIDGATATEIFAQIGLKSRPLCVILDQVERLDEKGQAALLGLCESAEQDDMRKLAVISVTNSGLDQCVKSGTFREALAHRLNGASFVLEPLRMHPDLQRRIEDLLIFEVKAARKEPISLDKEAMLVLEKYHWPGNLRELRNALLHAIALCDEDIIGLEHLPEEIVNEIARKDLTARSQSEAARIEAALRFNSGNVTRTARYLGMSRATLYRKIQIQKVRIENDAQQGG